MIVAATTVAVFTKAGREPLQCVAATAGTALVARYSK